MFRWLQLKPFIHSTHYIYIYKYIYINVYYDSICKWIFNNSHLKFDGYFVVQTLDFKTIGFIGKMTNFAALVRVRILVLVVQAGICHSVRPVLLLRLFYTKKTKYFFKSPSHYLNQCSLIVNLTIMNKLQWNSYHNTELFIQENAFEMSSAKMAAILSTAMNKL